MRDKLLLGSPWRWLAAAAAVCLSMSGCAAQTGGGLGGSGGSDTTTSTTSTSSTTSTGTGGSSPCAEDCSKIQTPPCLMAVCNTGQVVGPVNACAVVNAPAGSACDDGQFCTVGDTCDGNGTCKGGPQNDCGMTAPDCMQLSCDELSHSCSPQPGNDGSSCTLTDLCQANGQCANGVCVGDTKDCSFSPDAECNSVACNPATGKCEPTPDASKNGQACVLTGDLCSTGRTCANGTCGGGTPKNCSALTVGCNNGVCDPTNGACVGEPVPAGGTCYSGIDQCHTGTCDATANCVPAAVADGTSCNDHNACTSGDTCNAGVCSGTTSVGCQLYFTSAFEPCPDGWTFTGDWQCGTPATVGPATAHGGSSCIATQIAANYHDNDDYTSTNAQSPPIDLTTATAPVLSFWTWIYTEGETYDGFNVKVSTDGGTTFTVVNTVTPAYQLTVNGESAWGGDLSAQGWQNYLVDLAAYAGHQIILRFSFRSDGSTNHPGVYIDDVSVAEPSAIPLDITTVNLPDAVAGSPYSTTVSRSGGSSAATWSMTGGTNNSWLTIDPMSGTLTGTPVAANLGPVTVNLQVSEPGVPGNVATKTLNFNVVNVVYSQTFEGNCNQNGWMLSGDWQCGSPSGTGPAAAFSGSRCIATVINGDYNDGDAWATTTATSPDIALTGLTHATLSFRMWMYSEGSTYDGGNLKISTNGGTSYAVVTNAIPAYNLSSVNNEPAWGDDLSAQGWQLVTADLGAYVGQTIRVRFAFRSDSSGTYPGMYIDDVLVAGN